jgi:hypothetical protein
VRFLSWEISQTLLSEDPGGRKKLPGFFVLVVRGLDRLARDCPNHLRTIFGITQRRRHMTDSTQRFEIKNPPEWMTKKTTQKKRIDNWIFKRALETAKRISSEREIRRLKWNI